MENATGSPSGFSSTMEGTFTTLDLSAHLYSQGVEVVSEDLCVPNILGG